MNFDIKDMKSWADRHDVNVGDKGYFTHNINWLKDDFELNVDTIACIRDDFGNCFVSEKSFNGINSFPFFVPLKAVKEDKPKEKKYRPFRTVAEVDELLAKDSVRHYCFVGSDLYLRYKAKPNITKHILITNLEVDTNTNELRFINGFTTNHLAKNFDIKIAGRWLPFGVEIEE